MIQPFDGTDIVVLEARHAGGSLRFDCEQTPHRPMTFDAVYRLFFRDNPDAVGTWENLSAWLAGKSWSIRRKTW
jgi:hypothetical protein